MTGLRPALTRGECMGVQPARGCGSRMAVRSTGRAVAHPFHGLAVGLPAVKYDMPGGIYLPGVSCVCARMCICHAEVSAGSAAEGGLQGAVRAAFSRMSCSMRLSFSRMRVKRASIEGDSSPPPSLTYFYKSCRLRRLSANGHRANQMFGLSS